MRHLTLFIALILFSSLSHARQVTTEHSRTQIFSQFEDCHINDTGDVICQSNYKDEKPYRFEGLVPYGPIVKVVKTAQTYDICALNFRGEVYCQIESNYSNAKHDFAQIKGLLEPVTDIEAGYLETCGILRSGRVQCWDASEKDSRGKKQTPTPKLITGIREPVLKLALPHYSYCAMTATSVYCWGRSTYHYKKPKRENGLFTPSSNKGKSDKPIHIKNLRGQPRDIVATANDVCVLLSSDKLQCFSLAGRARMPPGATVTELEGNHILVDFNSPILNLFAYQIPNTSVSGEQILCVRLVGREDACDSDSSSYGLTIKRMIQRRFNEPSNWNISLETLDESLKKLSASVYRAEKNFLMVASRLANNAETNLFILLALQPFVDSLSSEYHLQVTQPSYNKAKAYYSKQANKTALSDFQSHAKQDVAMRLLAALLEQLGPYLSEASKVTSIDIKMQLATALRGSQSTAALRNSLLSRASENLFSEVTSNAQSRALGLTAQTLADYLTR